MTAYDTSQNFFRELREKLVGEIDISREVNDAEILKMIDELIMKESKASYITLEERQSLRRELFHSVRKLDILQELIEDPSITEIMINGMEDIFIEREGKIQRWDRRFTSKQKLEDVVQQIVAKCNRVVNESSPVVDARLSNRDRVHIVLEPVALTGPVVTIRRFPGQRIDMEQLINWESISREAADFLAVLVKSGFNIFVSGGTGSGKTTFLNALSAFIPKDERIITIEDNAELQIQNIPNLVSLEARMENGEGCREITIRDLIRAALRMRPSRIIVGEVRGGEAIDLLQAYNTGHDGSFSSGHGNSPRDMLNRLETMVLMGMDLPLPAIRSQIASGIDIMVHMGRLRDKSRRVMEIVEILGYQEGEIQTSVLYQFEEEAGEKHGRVTGSLKKIHSLKNRFKLELAGTDQEI